MFQTLSYELVDLKFEFPGHENRPAPSERAQRASEAPGLYTAPGKTCVPDYIYIYIYMSFRTPAVAVPGWIELKFGTIGSWGCISRRFLAICEIFIFKDFLGFWVRLGRGFRVG